MIREARIILPDTPETHDAHEWLEDKLTFDFGGYTRIEGFGAWLDDHANTVKEPVSIYDVAMSNDFGSSAWIQLKAIAQMVCFLAKQDCVYVRSASGEVFFIKA